ncbi:CubicO group peptidase, beta-lactamase class C family [Cyclonatronum proteinivorum]|uniref:CubicO group peptidase, beta-lactamase class C family n=1 Tax=Cyclonatronum proteinivorum TaxID=1457365 RepID=A0A345ULL3_9BACT|nr:CubicO group peptidase, beta-lactamase class C family [Cyclonatronum proteinivorum]
MVTVLVSFAGLPAAAQQFDEDIKQTIQDYLKAHQANGTFSGEVKLKLHDQTATWRTGYRYFSRLQPFQEGDLFRIGSLTKPVVASWFGRRFQDGTLNPGSFISAWFPEQDQWEDITLSHLLAHTSGIRNYTALPDFPETLHLPASIDEIIQRFADLPLESEPGSTFSYSNSGYILLSKIMALETGLPFMDAIDAFIAEELEIENMMYERPDSAIDRLVTGYTDLSTFEESRFIHMSLPLGAGGLMATGSAMIDFTERMYDEAFLSEHWRRTLLDPQSGNYAHGFATGPVLSRPSIGHAGGINGFASNWLHFPVDSLTVVILSNYEAANVGPIMRDIVSIVFGRSFDMPVVREPIRLQDEELERFSGRFEINPGFSIQIRNSESRLFAQGTGQPEVELFPESPTKFFLRQLDVQIEFIYNAETGIADRLKLYQSGMVLEGRRVP